MTKLISKFVVLLVTLVVVGMTGCASYGPTLPKSQIMPDVPADVRLQIEELYSFDPRDRANALDKLGYMGAKASPAVPFMADLLNDHDSTYEQRRTGACLNCMIGCTGLCISSQSEHYKKEKKYRMCVAVKAAKALAKIKDPGAVEPLMAALKKGGPKEDRAAFAEALMEIVGKEVGNDPQKLKEWLNKNKKEMR